MYREQMYPWKIPEVRVGRGDAWGGGAWVGGKWRQLLEQQ